MNRKFSGAEKVAILLMDLGEEKAARVLENMDELENQRNEIHSLDYLISSLA